MERDLKVLLTVDDNSYRITIKTRGFANAVPFSEFKNFLDDKHRQLFHDVNYVWKIFDADFGEYITLENNSMIYDLSKIKAIRDESRLHANFNVNAGIFDRNRDMQNYATQKNQIPIERRDSGLLQRPQMDLRDFVACTFRTPEPRSQNAVNVNTFDSYYPNRLPLISPMVQDTMSPIYSTPNHSREMGYRRSPSRLIPMDLNYSSNSFDSSFNYSSDSHRMSSSSYSEVPRSRVSEKDSLLYRSLQHDLYPHSSKRHKSPEPRSSNRNRVLSTPLYLKRTSAQEKKLSSRPIPKLMKPSSPIRERSKKLSDSSKKFLHQRAAAAAAERKLPVKVTKTAVSSKDLKSQKQSKQVPNCVKNLEPKRRDYFKAEDKKLGKALITAVKKYNEEFATISMFEDIWETNRIWTYIAKELSNSSEVRLKPPRKAVRCRRYFRGMLRRYLIILEDFWNWSEFEAQELWPFFEFFHKELDLAPFDKEIVRLKECFIKKVKPVKQAKETKNKSETENKNKKKEDKKKLSFDEKYDIRLLMAVSEHIEDFRKDTILESDVWTEVAVDLNDPPILDPTLLEKSRIKWETRFYSLLSEFQKLLKKETPLSGSERTLKFLFDKLDITPFIKEGNESDDDSASNASLEEIEKEMLIESKTDVVTVDDDKMVDIAINETRHEEKVTHDEEMKNELDETAKKKEIEEFTIDENSQTEASACLIDEILDTISEAQPKEDEIDITESKTSDVISDVQEVEPVVANESLKTVHVSNEEILVNQGIADCKISSVDDANSEIKEVENNQPINESNAADSSHVEMKVEENDALPVHIVPADTIELEDDCSMLKVKLKKEESSLTVKEENNKEQNDSLTVITEVKEENVSETLNECSSNATEQEKQTGALRCKSSEIIDLQNESNEAELKTQQNVEEADVETITPD